MEAIEKKYAVMLEGKQTPSKFYNDYNEAESEAKRLVSVEKKTAYVLLAITKLELNDVRITSIA